MHQFDAIAYPNPTGPLICHVFIHHELRVLADSLPKGAQSDFRHVEKWKLTKLSQKPFGIIDYHWRNDVQLIFHLDYAHIPLELAFSNLGTFFLVLIILRKSRF